MNKVEKDGKVAVLYIKETCFYCWTAWNDDKYYETLAMDADIVNAVISGNFEEAKRIAEEKCPGMNSDGYKHLAIEWIDKGYEFEIKEHNWRETVNVIGYFSNLIA